MGGETEELLRFRKLAGVQRRMRALPEEIKGWRQRTEGSSFWERHHSQVHALEVYMGQLVELMDQRVEQARRLTGSLEFVNGALDLEIAANECQRIWQFFRDKLGQRWSEDSGPVLRVADTVAWDCYHLAIDQARNVYRVIDSWDFREPPLVYADVRFSPATFMRGLALREAGFDVSYDRLEGIPWNPRSLPIPLVVLPWDRLCNPWELLSLHHEVAHDIDKDLDLLSELEAKIAPGGDEGQRAVWQRWLGEIFADVAAILFAGPAFIGFMVDLLSFPQARIQDVQVRSVHPPPHVRVRLLTAFAGSLGIPEAKKAAEDYQAVWNALYGDLPQFQTWLDQASQVAEAVASTTLERLGGVSLLDLVPLSRNEVRLTEIRAGTLQAGSPLAAGSLEPRFICAASRLAFEAIVAQGQGATQSEELDRLANNTLKSIESNTPPGKRAGRQPPENAIKDRARLFLRDVSATGAAEVH